MKKATLVALLVGSILLLGILATAPTYGDLIDEDFEGATWPPSGWTENSVDQSSTYNHTPDGQYSAKLSAAGDYLITPQLVGPGDLTFWYFTTPANPDVNVMYSTNLSDWYHISGSPFSGTTGQWVEITRDVSSYGTIYIRWTKSIVQSNLYVDDVLVTSGGPTPTSTPTGTPTSTPTITGTPTITPTPTVTPTPTSTPTITGTPTITPTPTVTPTPTSTPTGPTPTPTATPTSAPSIVFAVIGDYGEAGPAELDVSTLVKGWDPDFIITTGDNNYFEGEAWTIDGNIGQYYSDYIYPYTGSYGSTATANLFFPSLGNHDWYATNAPQPYLDYFTLPGNERYYDFTQGPVHFFVVDSDTNEPDGTSSGSIQGTWLQNQLAASSAPWKLVYMHHAPYGSGSRHGNSTWMQWPYETWGATAVLAGHDHTYERIILNGFPYFVNGLGGESIHSFTTPVSGSQVRYNSDYGAMKVEASAASISFQFIDRSGATIDSYALFRDFPLRFNFQPLPSQSPGTYIIDSGSAYGTQGDYGWQ